jgi:hypothetical protein
MTTKEAPGWATLKCSCGSSEFLHKITLRWREGSGTTEAPAGYRCRQCDGDVDPASLIRIAQVSAKRAELAALQEELGGPPLVAGAPEGKA